MISRNSAIAQASKLAAVLAVVFILSFYRAYSIPTNWVDSLNSRVLNKTLNIYDPDIFLKKTIADTNRLNQFVELSEQNNNFQALSFAYNMYGKNKLNHSEYSEAIQYHSKAYNVALTTNDDYLEALSLNMMGVVYRRKSAVKSSLEYYMRALRTAEESSIKDNYMLKSIAISCEGIGGVYRLLGQYELAISYFKQSLKFEEQLESLLGMAIDNHNIGKSFELMGLLDSAKFYHEKSLSYDERMNSTFGKAVCYNNLGKVMILKKKFKLAHQYLVPALKMSEQAGDSSFIVNSNINLGWYYVETKNYDSAYFRLKKALEIARRIDHKEALMRTYELLSILEQQKNNFPSSLNFFKLSNSYKDSISSEKNQQYLADLTILYEIEKKQRMIKKLQDNAELNQKIQQGKNVLIGLLGLVALILVMLIIQKLQSTKKNKVIHKQKENLYSMELEMKTLQTERLLAENKQKESEKQLLEEKLLANELAKQNEIKAMQKEIDHKNRELAAAATYAIKKSESLKKLHESIEKLKDKTGSTSTDLNKLQKELKQHINPEADWENFSLHFETVHPSFFKNLKLKHANITNNELRLCAYLLMNLNNKEIALLLFISSDAVQKAKYRLKKKFNLANDDNLYDYLIKIG